MHDGEYLQYKLDVVRITPYSKCLKILPADVDISTTTYKRDYDNARCLEIAVRSGY